MNLTRIVIFIISVFFMCAVTIADNEVCMDCHSDDGLTTERRGREISLFVDESAYSGSVHGDIECIDCHEDADVEDFPHEEVLEPVFCGNCHDDKQLNFDAGIHGQAFKRKAPYAPDCAECHGKHNIQSAKDPKSPTYKMQIPYLCGGCHREGAPVARVYDISEHNILENYSQSMHGAGMFQKGLTVTATCTDCHRSHMILPRSFANSSVSRQNVVATCMNCHARIEEVHVQVISGELWELQPGAIPACTDCHLPHQVRKESVALNITDRACLKCHEKQDVHKTVDGEKVSLFVDKEKLSDSRHRNIPCVKCHSDVKPGHKRPCITAGKVECSTCHAKVSQEYYASGHGEAYTTGKKNVPYCVDCHGDHQVFSHLDEDAPTFRAEIPKLCGECHKEEGKASEAHLKQTDAFADYSTSVHGRGLTQKGLLPSAICTDCHNTHLVLSSEDPTSSVHHKNIPATCSTCHRGIFKEFIKSIHFSLDKEKEEKLPICSDCHSSHTISTVQQDKFVHEVTNQCGSCHEDLASTYFETMHGKAYNLGYVKAAKCSDCHGAHDILGVNNPDSKVGFNNVVTTCQQCHSNANEKFAGYLTHATHHDKVKYPILYYTYWFMTLLLLSVFGFFGIHTLLWLPRSIRQMLKKNKEEKEEKEDDGTLYIKRFNTQQRVTHIFVIVSFILLALTGMAIKFSTMPWARFIAEFFGGVHGAGLVHRAAAIITFGYFFYHLYTLYLEKRRLKVSWLRFIFNDSSLMFNWQDVKDFGATMKWFFGFGARPNYGRWTYWEKFDYFAVFWGVAIIGLSGLMKWYPEYFTYILPGWAINVAGIVHSDEALLAVGFIFTIHFFNTHMRPEAFPMDKVIFSGLVPLEEYKIDRPREYDKLVASGELEKRTFKGQISERRIRVIKIFGFSALFVGITLIGLIIYSVLFGYS
jgi:thiosulfate reductase cytochrome b subunit